MPSSSLSASRHLPTARLLCLLEHVRQTKPDLADFKVWIVARNFARETMELVYAEADPFGAKGSASNASFASSRAVFVPGSSTSLLHTRTRW